MTRATFRDMTDVERRAASALRSARYAPATFDKRFARNLRVESGKITDKQATIMWRNVWRYRRSISDADLVETARRINAQDVTSSGQGDFFKAFAEGASIEIRRADG